MIELAERMEDFLRFRAEYPEFVYESCRYEDHGDRLDIVYDFRVSGLAEFHPTWSIPRLEGSHSAGDPETLDELVFSLGLVELVSYWKSACPPQVRVKGRALTPEQIQWWKKLYFNGLGEFFYTNGIQADDSFMEIVCGEGAKTSPQAKLPPARPEGLPKVLIPVGGGKDSAVTIELLNGSAERYCYIINPRQATRDTVEVAGLAERTVAARRTIDPALLELNRRGFLNGHTPFSAIAAFSSVIAAYLNGLSYAALSNESSANESTVAGSTVNHQYSKSFEFEQDFIRYEAEYIGSGVGYFSLLRPLSEFQIAKLFSRLTQYHPIFRSCNAGSKTDVWCGNCPKCLFVYIILSPFLSQDELRAIFHKDMLDDLSLADTFEKLTGLQAEKPFECVGSRDEVHTALQMALRRFRETELPLPALLERYAGQIEGWTGMVDYQSYFDRENALPPRFLTLVERAAGQEA